jgi:hypothetical protein
LATLNVQDFAKSHGLSIIFDDSNLEEEVPVILLGPPHEPQPALLPSKQRVTNLTNHDSFHGWGN